MKLRQLFIDAKDHFRRFFTNSSIRLPMPVWISADCSSSDHCRKTCLLVSRGGLPRKSSLGKKSDRCTEARARPSSRNSSNCRYWLLFEGGRKIVGVPDSKADCDV